MPADRSIAGRIYQGGKLQKGVLHLDTATGRIEKVAKSATLDDHTDFGDRAILPGAIDVHVHFRDPGATHKEDIRTGSTSAAFGGVTAYVDMPNTNPPTTTKKALDAKLARMASESVVDYGVWSGATWYLDDLPEMLKRSIGIKIYLGATTGDLLVEENDRVQEALRIAGEAGKPVILHCEAQRVLSRFRGAPQSLPDHDRLRPPVAEVEAIYDVMKMLPGIKTPPPTIHVAHTASVEALNAAEAARFSAGVCPHHLLLDTTRFDTEPTRGKMNPPLRGPDARQALWDAYAAGRFRLLESDHAPHTKTEKGEGFPKAPAGVPGVETLLPLMLAKVAAGDLDLRVAVESVTTGPASLLGLDDRGVLEAGKKADFAVYDLEAVAPIDEKALHSKCGWSPYDGMDAVFPTHTYLAGEPVVADGKLVGRPGGAAPLVADDTGS